MFNEAAHNVTHDEANCDERCNGDQASGDELNDELSVRSVVVGGEHLIIIVPLKRLTAIA
ncbi:MAG TPA: hypothetical protein VGR43_11410 [Dehalococcoidia bacterium]|jgi:hypothetical protein|nr:hypothetical protein [Dehalococcoidia bacterium]